MFDMPVDELPDVPEVLVAHPMPASVSTARADAYNEWGTPGDRRARQALKIMWFLWTGIAMRLS
jgi:hypothetical protein